MAASENALFSPVFLSTTSDLLCCEEDESGADWDFDADSMISIFTSLSFFAAKFALHAGTVAGDLSSSFFCSSMLGRFAADVNLFATEDEDEEEEIDEEVVGVALIDGDLFMAGVEEAEIRGFTDDGCVKEA